MHQSISAVPIFPQGNCRAFAHPASPGGGHLALCLRHKTFEHFRSGHKFNGVFEAGHLPSTFVPTARHQRGL